MVNKEIFDKINKIINSPVKNYSGEEAIKMLQEVGILDNNGDIVEIYKDLIVKENQ